MPTRKAPPKDLPAHYYHSHFVEVLAFLETHYAAVLQGKAAGFRQSFLALSFDAQCLYVRLLNRRGQLFKRNSLRYPEITSMADALQELQAAQFVETPTVVSIPELLRLMTRQELYTTLRPQLSNLKSTSSKADLLALAQQHLSAQQLFETLPTQNIIAQGHFITTRFLLFLYFGQIQDGLSQFTLRDLGIMRARASSDDYEPRFTTRDEAAAAFFFASRLEQLKQQPECATALFEELPKWSTEAASTVDEWRDRLALHLGKALEHDTDAALQVYGRGESVKCSERTVRLLLASGRRDQAKAYLERCIDTPRCDEEALFASDLYQRKFNKKRTSSLTDALRAAQLIDIDDAYRGSPEYAAVRWFQRQGCQAYKAENRVWRMLFGLMFWDLLFEGPKTGVYSPFDRVPSALLEGQFLTRHETTISERLALLNEEHALKRHLLRVSAAKFGTNNGLFRWRQSTHDALFALIERASPQALREQLLRFCENFNAARQGNPDLLVVDNEGVRFVEIKAPGDQLKRQQLLRLKQLRASGFRADVVRVRYVLDPQQTYTVVDVETTGGRGDLHRVTEIGAVKVMNGQVVDEFHSLINPQRSIPANITRLTGIDSALVAEAPVFADIAEPLLQFLDGSIFVAHNVEFDYRFITQEFQRWGHNLRMPKLCTCASMRKLYPGHKSYGLAALTEAYNIPLERHHRALCDAKAAAELLVLVNAKREELLASETAHGQSQWVF